MKKANEKGLVKTNALPSKQKKYLSLKCLPYLLNVCPMIRILNKVDVGKIKMTCLIMVINLNNMFKAFK